MAATLHLGIRAAVAALLNAGTALAGGRIHQNRHYVLASSEASAIWVNRLDTAPERVVLGRLDWRTELDVVIRTRTSGGTSAESAADTLSEAVFARVMTNPTLDGAAIDTVPGAITWEDEEADTPIAVCALRFTVIHRTSEESLSA